MIKRFTADDDLKESSKITQVQGTKLKDHYLMYKDKLSQMAQQPMRSEEELCLSDKRVSVNVSNIMINPDEIHDEPLFNLTLDILKQYSIYNVITLTTDAP
ncbi:hypothetical protein Tco_0004505 [Tanacetum coccineum]